jgi:predicted ATPase
MSVPSFEDRQASDRPASAAKRAPERSQIADRRFFRPGDRVIMAAGNADACPEAETLFLRSIDISRRQKALSWELRSATSLARLWHVADRTRKASDVLSEVYGCFTEGFATRDLVEAKKVLDALH